MPVSLVESAPLLEVALRAKRTRFSPQPRSLLKLIPLKKLQFALTAGLTTEVGDHMIGYP